MIAYTPIGSNTQLILASSGKESSSTLSTDMVYNLTVNGIAEIVNTTIGEKGNMTIKKLDHDIEKFERNYPPSNLIFSFATGRHETKVATLQTVADVLKGIQEMTHICLLEEMLFLVYSLNDKENPIAEGCLGYHCWDDLREYNAAATQIVMNANKGLDRTPGLTPDLTIGNQNDGINITISDSLRSNSIQHQNYADVATEMLWRMIPMIVKAEGDSPLPKDDRYNRPEWHFGDEIWHSSFSLSFWQPIDTELDFTLRRVAETLSYVEKSWDKESWVESRMVVRLSAPPDTIWKVSGIGCMSYTPSPDNNVKQSNDGYNDKYDDICHPTVPALGAIPSTQPSPAVANISPSVVS